MRLERSPLSRFAAAGAPPVPYRGEVPLEALAEREPLQVAADPRRDRRLAAEAGQMFLRMLERAGVSAATRAAFAAESAFSLTADAGDDGAGAAYLALMAGRVPDGFKLYTALASGLPARPVVPAADAPKVTAVRPAYRAWYEARYGASTGLCLGAGAARVLVRGGGTRGCRRRARAGSGRVSRRRARLARLRRRRRPHARRRPG